MAKKSKTISSQVDPSFNEFTADSVRSINRAKPLTFLLTPAHIALVQTAAMTSGMSWREFVALAVLVQAKNTLNQQLPKTLSVIDYDELYPSLNCKK